MATSPRALASPPPLHADRHCLLLDFDGTLVEIVDQPDAVVVDEALARLLEHLIGTFAGRVALVSGRSVAQIERFLAARATGIAVVGSHGAELRIGDQRSIARRPTALLEAERVLGAAFAGVKGVVIEVKSLGVAVHYRLAPRQEAQARRLVEPFVGLEGLVLQEGKMMVELRVGGHDKGSGIVALLEQAPFAGSIPIFLGDDVTDEAGFVAVAERGGIGVLVGAERISAAQFRLPDVTAVRAWLGAAA